MNKEGLVSFENEIREAWESGKIKCPVHFCGGNEDQLVEYFIRHVAANDWVFSTWRNHYHWLLKTNDPDYLRKKIFDENNSMHIVDLSRRFISSAIVGGTCAPAVGTAYAIKLKKGTEKVHCFIGDGAMDQGWFWESWRYALGQDLPITFIIEDNNRSVCTTIEERWGKNDQMMSGICNTEKVHYYDYIPTYPHVGTGKEINW